MQYIYRSLYIFITVLLLSSCESNNALLEEEEHADLFFMATLPQELKTRSYGDGKQANILHIGVFDSQKKEIMRKTFPIEGATIDISISLTKNRTYNIVFWAQNSDCNVYDTSDMKSIKMSTATFESDFDTVEKMDAFFATCKGVTTNESSIHTVELVRPLAQVNIGTSGQSSANAIFKIIGAPTSFNPFTEEVGGTENTTFIYNTIPNKTFTVEGVNYNYLAIGYLFASINTQTFNCELELKETEGAETVKYIIPEVHFQSNKRTNIIGSLTGD